MTRVYVVEDNPNLLDDCLLYLNTQEFECYGAVDGKGLDILLEQQLPDVIVLDWVLPGETGLAIAERLRADSKTSNVGIIFLTGYSHIDNRIAGLEFADSYHVKPIDYRELAAVITSIQRRTTNSSPLSTKSLSWQLHEKTLTLQSPYGKNLRLSHREYIMLHKLALQHAGPLSAKQIIEAWDEDWLTFEKNRLELLLSRLRTKIKAINDVKLNPIRAIRNQGYQLMIPLEIHK